MQKQPKNILIATGLYPPDIGGPATYTKMLEEKLPEADFTLDIYPFGLVRKYPKIIRHIVYALGIIKRARQADVIYALDPVSVGLPALVAKWLTKKPFLLRLGGDYAWEQGQGRYGVTMLLDEFVKNRRAQPFRVRALHAIQSYVGKRATRINVQSRYMQDIVATWGVPRDRIDIIPSALHPATITERRDQLRNAFEYNGVTITTAGRLVKWKGIDVLIRLVPKLRERFGIVTLVIIGDGPERESLERLTASVGVGNAVRFAGRQPQDAMGAAIYASDLFVYNTAYEGLSHQLLEVMDLGVPIVTTDIRPNQELLKDGVSGLLVPVNDSDAFLSSIERVIENENLRQQLTQHARAATKGYSESATIDRITELLQSV